jgi:hypothetical protein
MNGRGYDDRRFYVQAFHDGTLEFVDGAVFYRKDDNDQNISVQDLEDTLCRQYEFARRVYATIGIDGRVAIYASALGVRDFTIPTASGIPRPIALAGYRPTIGRDPALFSVLVLDNMQANAITALEPLVQLFWRACGYTGKPDFD